MNTASKILLVALALNCSSLAIAAKYTFTRVYTGPAQPGVAINDNGLVALISGDYSSYYSLITTDANTTTFITGPMSTTQYGLGLNDNMQALSLNNNGFVAFHGRDSVGRVGLFKSDGTSAYTLAADYQNGGSFNAIGKTAMSINDSGMVAFVAQNFGSDYRVFLSDGTAVPVQLNDHPGHAPAINHTGTVAYRYFDAGNQIYYPMKIQLGSEILSLPGMPFSMPDIHDLDVVAFCAFFDGTQKVVIGNGISSPSYIDGSSYYGLTDGIALDGRPASCAINNQGLMVFGAAVSIDTQIKGGIFTGPDPVNDKVIQAGDLLDGVAVENLGFSRNGLNNLGQIAFWAQLSDGTKGVWVATPVLEPSTLILLAVGAIGLLAYVWHRRSMFTP